MVQPAHTSLRIFLIATWFLEATLTETSVVDLMNQLEEWNGPDLQEQKNVALVLGSSAWDLLLPVDVQGPSFEKHLRACPQYLQAVKDKYPNVTVFWRLPSAMVSLTKKEMEAKGIDRFLGGYRRWLWANQSQSRRRKLMILDTGISSFPQKIYSKLIELSVQNAIRLRRYCCRSLRTSSQ